MSRQPTPTDLKNFMSKLAKINRAQAALPPAMRGLIPMAMGVGRLIAKVTNGNDFIERHILGKPSVEDDSIALPEPAKEKSNPSATDMKNGNYRVENNPTNKKQ